MKWRVRSVFVPMACLAFAATAYAGDDASSKAAPKAQRSAEQIQKLVAELDSNEFAVRRNATKELSEAGRPAIGPLSQAAKTGSLEVVTRSISILEKIYVRGDDQTADDAEAAFEELSRLKNQSVAGRAEAVLAKRYEVRERRAIAEIQRAGGIFKRGATDENVDLTATPGLSYPDLTLHLGKEWKAGDAGLKHVQRLTRLQNVRFIPGTNGVTKKGLDGLMAAIPGVIIHERGAAKLGMVGQPSVNIPGCEVQNVAPGSAAEAANLQPGDIVTRFGDKPIENFDMLVDLIKTKKPGDKIDLQVVRPGTDGPLTLPVVLKGWD